eukprot:10438869-Ditylum_brightwellii.AAC.1
MMTTVQQGTDNYACGERANDLPHDNAHTNGTFTCFNSHRCSPKKKKGRMTSPWSSAQTMREKRKR